MSDVMHFNKQNKYYHPEKGRKSTEETPPILFYDLLFKIIKNLRSMRTIKHNQHLKL